MSDELREQAQEQSAAPAVETSPSPAPKESDKESNLRNLRERAEAAERRARDLEQAIQQNMSQQKATKLEIEEDDFSIDDDSLIEGKHLKKMYSKQKRELAEIKKMLQDTAQQNSSSAAEWRLKTRYNDFDSVVNEDNIRKLAEVKPAMYRSMLANPDLYEKGETAYEMIKSWVVEDKYASQDKKLEENRSKPRSASSAPSQTADTPLAHISDYDRRVLTEERKEQLRRQVEEAKRYG